MRYQTRIHSFSVDISIGISISDTIPLLHLLGIGSTPRRYFAHFYFVFRVFILDTFKQQKTKQNKQKNTDIAL